MGMRRPQQTEIVVDGWVWKYSPAYSVYVIEGSTGGPDKPMGWFVHANNEVEVRQKTARLRADGFKPIDSYMSKVPSTGQQSLL